MGLLGAYVSSSFYFRLCSTRSEKMCHNLVSIVSFNNKLQQFQLLAIEHDKLVAIISCFLPRGGHGIGGRLDDLDISQAYDIGSYVN